jgi:excisionase family DNA binding protein
MTIDEAATYLNVAARWVADAVRQRKVRCTRIGKHVRFRVEHLEPQLRPRLTAAPRSTRSVNPAARLVSRACTTTWCPSSSRAVAAARPSPWAEPVIRM